MIARVQGGVRPSWLHGSSVTKRVAPRADSPARLSAITSACEPGGDSVTPSAMVAPSRETTTAPTAGLGEVGGARRASSSARCIGSGITAPLLSHSGTDSGRAFRLGAWGARLVVYRDDALCGMAPFRADVSGARDRQAGDEHNEQHCRYHLAQRQTFLADNQRLEEPQQSIVVHASN